MILDATKCYARVRDSTGWHEYQCQKKPVIERGGTPYCKIHDPLYIKKKGEERQARWNEEREEKRIQRDLWDARDQATQGLTIRELKQVTPELIREMIRKL